MGVYSHLVPRKILLLFSQVLMVGSCTLLALANSPDRYWSYIFPAMIVNTIGVSGALLGATVTVLANAPAGEEGIVSAVLGTTFYIGSTIGVTVSTAISLGVGANLPMDVASQFKPHAAVFWSFVGMHGMMVIISTIFVHA